MSNPQAERFFHWFYHLGAHFHIKPKLTSTTPIYQTKPASCRTVTLVLPSRPCSKYHITQDYKSFHNFRTTAYEQPPKFKHLVFVRIYCLYVSFKAPDQTPILRHSPTTGAINTTQRQSLMSTLGFSIQIQFSAHVHNLSCRKPQQAQGLCLYGKRPQIGL